MSVYNVRASEQAFHPSDLYPIFRFGDARTATRALNLMPWASGIKAPVTRRKIDETFAEKKWVTDNWEEALEERVNETRSLSTEADIRPPIERQDLYDN